MKRYEIDGTIVTQLFLESAEILAEDTSPSSMKLAQVILEDQESPLTQRYQAKLFQDVIDKKHIDFDKIPDSKGVFSDYSGYGPMMETISTLRSFAESQKATVILRAIETVSDAASNLMKLSALYKRGFVEKNEYVILEYNTIAATCIEGATSLLYEFIDYMKRPDASLDSITFKNTKLRPDLFYIEQLSKYNNVAKTPKYTEYLKKLLDGDKENFDMYSAIGLAATGLVAVVSVPVVRELVYQFYRMKQKLHDSCELQAAFLEMNKTRLMASNELDTRKRDKIIQKQEKARQNFLRLADKLRLDRVVARKAGQADLMQANQMVTPTALRQEVDDSPLELL